MRELIHRVSVRVFQSADEKLAAERNVDVHVAVHGVLTQQVDSEFFPGLCESPLTVQGDHIGEYPATFVPMG